MGKTEQELDDVCVWAPVLWCGVQVVWERLGGISVNGEMSPAKMAKQLRQKARAEVREVDLYLAERPALRTAEAERLLARG